MFHLVLTRLQSLFCIYTQSFNCLQLGQVYRTLRLLVEWCGLFWILSLFHKLRLISDRGLVLSIRIVYRLGNESRMTLWRRVSTFIFLSTRCSRGCDFRFICVFRTLVFVLLIFKTVVETDSMSFIVHCYRLKGPRGKEGKTNHRDTHTHTHTASVWSKTVSSIRTNM